ncbi:juvenile hormone acid O-methyltransferase isoform X3 [Solenopsis invicta]|uniref:juvenile hormone acid O-methyltransferase isoform X3 n=1 Tax=Solenopsis invicta TaxID=13686 RepID=UPI00193E3F78|nr:juvenile hormone acid O-methyltransferase isoform X3 [Solenopsis invicta]
MSSPEVYSANDNRMKNNIAYILEEFAENLINIRGKCMDVGCGPGNATRDLLLPALGSDARIIGTDISEKMIKYANVTSSDEKRVQFEVLDIETKNLPKKYITEFEHVFSFHALHWCCDIRQAFKNIYEVLQPNGTLLLNIVAFQDIFEVLRILARDVRFEQYIPDKMKNSGLYHNSKNARKELKELLQSVGFTVHHCSLREASYSQEKPEQFVSTDISEEMIKYANVTSNDEKRVEFEVLDIATKNLPKKYITEFEQVFSFHALHWCCDIRQAFKNIYQILRPNGTALLYIVASHDMFEVLRILARDVRFEQYIPDKIKTISPYHDSKNARKELKELLQSIGFTVHHCSLRETSYSEKKSEQLLKSVISLLAFLEIMPNDVMEKFKKVLIHEYLKRKINYKSIDDKELTLDLYTVLVVYAQKIV